VDLNYFLTITSLNIIVTRMNAGKKRVEDEQAASIDSDKQFRFDELE
jgi:hypothetical protein